MYYKKLNITHDLKDSDGELQFKHGVDWNGKFLGISYYSVNDEKIADTLLSYIPEQYKKDFNPYKVEIIDTPFIQPHCEDGEGGVAINFYIEAKEGYTCFYSLKENEKGYHLPTHDDDDEGQVFDMDQIIFEDSFKAESGEVWMLKVNSPHGVFCHSGGKRSFYSLLTAKYDFETVKEMLNNFG